ncbi:MAG: hypothetical protein FD181_3773 [Prolixibacteraceae bacterium]|nr:MAG: hypothetical protein FD181_3773 [Prolixibacteraceae bacterium]
MTDFNFLVISTKEISANQRDFSFPLSRDKLYLVEMTARFEQSVIYTLCLMKLGKLSG